MLTCHRMARMAESMKYRSDIDGLRAIAVLPVLLFHAGLPAVSGGYAGVDIFFVISGFLITSLILPDITAGTFSLKQFYERRIRRIFPMLFLIVTASLLMGFMFMIPGQLEEYAKSALAALFSVSNIFFWKQDSYFAESADLKPLLHTWSLGIEEQYYIAFPLLLLMLWRFRKSEHLIMIVAGAAFFSLILANWGGILDGDMRDTITGFPITLTPEYGYYHLATRAWELLCGSLAAILMWQHADRVAAVRTIPATALSWLGFIAIISSYTLLERHTPYPSLYTLPAVLGATAIILFCRPASVLHRLLSWHPFVFTGLISYSLYLWHQPVFAFARILWPDLDQTGFYLLIAGTYALSILSWLWIETPFRNRQIISADRLYRIMGVWFAALVLVTAITAQQKGFLAYYPPFQQQFYINHDERGSYVQARFDSLRNKPFPKSSQKNLLIIGDSHAQDFTNALFESGLDHGWAVSTLQMAARCQIYMGPEDPFTYIKQEDHTLCQQQRLHFSEALPRIAQQAGRIILAASWQLWAAERMDVTLRNIQQAAPQAEIIVIGRKYFDTLSYQDYRQKTRTDGVQVMLPIRTEDKIINTALKEKVGSTRFVDLYDIICHHATSCPLLTPEGRIISYDGGHLTQDGARFIGQRLQDLNVLQ